MPFVGYVGIDAPCGLCHLALVAGLHAPAAGGIVFGIALRDGEGVGVVAHVLYGPVGGLRHVAAVDEGGQHAVAHIGVGPGAEEIVAVLAGVVGVEVVGAFGHRGVAAQHETHRTARRYDGLCAPCLAFAEVAPRAYVVEVHQLPFGQGGKLSARQLALFLHRAKLLPLRIGLKEGTCALHHVQRGLGQWATAKHVAAQLQVLWQHSAHGEVCQAQTVAEALVAQAGETCVERQGRERLTIAESMGGQGVQRGGQTDGCQGCAAAEGLLAHRSDGLWQRERLQLLAVLEGAGADVLHLLGDL